MQKTKQKVEFIWKPKSEYTPLPLKLFKDMRLRGKIKVRRGNKNHMVSFHTFPEKKINDNNNEVHAWIPVKELMIPFQRE